MEPHATPKENSRHGEYKVPGGKLVVIDLEIEDGQMRNVMLSGDFFLEPPEALDTITGAIEGAPVDEEPEVLVARIEASLPQGAALIGFTAEAVTIAVERALS